MVEFLSDPTMLYWGLILTNGLWFFVSWSLRRMIGVKHFDSALKAVTRRIKKPARFHKFYKSQYLESEIMDTNEIDKIKFYPNYTVPLTINEAKRYNGESQIKEYVLIEGALENIDPAEKEQPFFNALLRLGETNNKMRDIEEARIRKKYDDDLVTKKHFNLWMVGLVIGLFVIGALIYQATEIVTSFQTTFETYKPAIDQAIQNIPHIS